MKYPIIHNVCGKLAFYALKDWRLGGVIRAADAVKLDGSTPRSGSEMKCGSCGQFIQLPPKKCCTFGDPIDD